MAKQILTNVRPFVVGVDLTAASNKFEITSEVEEKDVTTFASEGWKEFVGGLGMAQVSAEGFWEAGDATMVDDAAWANLGGVGPWSICPSGADVGSLAYLATYLEPSYTLLGSVGDVAPFQLAGTSSSRLVRGVVAHPPGTARTASGTGTSLNLGAVTAGQRLWAALHVLSVSSTLSLTVRIETDTATGFPSADTALTFSAATNANSPQGQWLFTDGDAITDTWQRAAWTTSGSGSALFVVTVGIA